MTKRKTAASYSPEVRERAARMVLDGAGEHGSQWAAIGSIAAKIGCTAETLRRWTRQAERDRGKRAGPTTEDRERSCLFDDRRGAASGGLFCGASDRDK